MAFTLKSLYVHLRTKENGAWKHLVLYTVRCVSTVYSACHFAYGLQEELQSLTKPHWT